ncbi:hypothetical protein HMPREF1548_05332 [Clostridium sp. KLE 1755]|jgi:hypothetical protein|nr:hypothetical protein HMPREF1548_05332 [Clostridium sp. KLE 1755]
MDYSILKISGKFPVFRDFSLSVAAKNRTSHTAGSAGFFSTKMNFYLILSVVRYSSI